MNVFVLNAGSSSFKAAYFEGDLETSGYREAAWSATVRWWSDAPERCELQWQTATENVTTRSAVGTHEHAATLLFTTAMETFGIAPDIIAHRVVHGLDEDRPAIVDARVRAKIEAAAELAPLHNRAALVGIDAGIAAFPAVPQAAVFDTSFHTTLPPEAAAFAGPYAWYATEGIRRFGFHGISHRYCAQRTANVLGLEGAAFSMVSAHIGSGASLAAIDRGRSVETTMGFTPLDGLMMGTRSGSIDPGLLLYFIRAKHARAPDLERLLNEESGLKGISGISEDVREVLAAEAGGDQRATLALAMYVHRLRAGIAAMAAAMNGFSVLSFTGGVGEHAAEIRRRVCGGLSFLGVPVLKASADDETRDREIGDGASRVRVAVIRAREEWAMASDVTALLERA